MTTPGPDPTGAVPEGADPLDASTLDRIEQVLLGGRRSLSLAQTAEQVRADVEDVRLFWHSLGLPTGELDAVAYTDADVDVLREILAARDHYELSERTSVSLVRAIGHTTDRLVLWQVEALVEHMIERFSLDDASARLLMLDRLPEIAQLLERQLVHAWRRHLAAIAARFAEEFGAAHEISGDDQLPLVRAVGFADVVAFTTRTAKLGSHDLADFVQDFEARARDVVTAGGGRVVKTIGDAVLFVADDPVTGAEVALGLAEAFGVQSPAPVRVSLVWGRLLSRFGDVFGQSVNLAARLTGEADPGSVLLDERTGELLAGESGAAYRLTPQPAREVPGLGLLAPVLLSRSDVPPG